MKTLDPSTHLFIKIILCISVYLTLFTNLYCQNKYWTPPTSNLDWSEKLNWTPNGIPTSSDTVYIVADSVHLDINADINSLIIVDTTFYLPASRTLTLLAGTNNELKLESSTMIIEGNLYIESGDTAVHVKAGSTLTNNGLLHIGEAVSLGIYNVGIINNNSIVRINNIEGHGIENEETFYNHTSAQIEIDDINGHGIQNKKTFHNNTSARIEINDINGSGHYGINNFYISDIFLNSGNILVDDSEFGGVYTWGNADFKNFDSITISNVANHGFSAHSYNFRNELDGVLTIKKCKNGITGSEFYNYGKIHLDSITDTGILPGGEPINNLNTIIITNAKIGIGGSLYNNNDPPSIRNYPQSLIDISNISDTGISYANTINNGTISIKNANNGFVGNFIINHGIFTVKDITNNGFEIRHGYFDGYPISGSLTNDSTIIIRNCGAVGLLTEGLEDFEGISKVTLTNKANGHIEIGGIIAIGIQINKLSNCILEVGSFLEFCGFDGAQIDIQLNATFECNGVIDKFGCE